MRKILLTCAILVSRLRAVLKYLNVHIMWHQASRQASGAKSDIVSVRQKDGTQSGGFHN